MSINVPTCHGCASHSTWHANVPTACQFLNLAYQRAKLRANFLFWRAKVPKGVLNFQTFLVRNASSHIKEKSAEFLFFFKLFCSLIKNENTKRPGFYA